MSSLPEPQPEFEQLEQPRSPWTMADLVVFGIFFALTVLLLPVSVLRVWHIFDPALRVSNLTATDQVVLQGLMNLVIVGFIVFLIRVVHRQSVVGTIHWFKNYQFGTGFLISLGATLAISVLIVSSFFPSGEQPPIERLLSSTSAVYVFAIFGIAVAPLFEEIIFRGFLFKVLSDMRGSGTAVSVTAILFALLHLPQLWGSWAGVVLIFVVGYVLSFVRQRSNSLIPSFIIHTSYNSMLFGVFAVSTLVQKGTGT
jgi:membrane protease YdiL (CAAX protease family)